MCSGADPFHVGRRDPQTVDQLDARGLDLAGISTATKVRTISAMLLRIAYFYGRGRNRCVRRRQKRQHPPILLHPLVQIRAVDLLHAGRG